MRPPRRNRVAQEDSTSEKSVRAAAVGLLARRDHSAQELKTKLEARGYDSDVAGGVLEDLERRKLVSDERFVATFVAQRARRGQGPVRIRGELRELGVADELVDRGLRDSELDWIAIAIEARQRRFGNGVPHGWPERAKQARFLQYRGFTADQIRTALGGADDGAEVGP